MKISKSKLIIAVVALALIAGVVRAVAHKRAVQQASAAPAPASQIELAANDVLTLTTQNLTQTLEISGTVKALNYAVIKARVAGELKEMTVREGDNVKAGQVLARIDPTEYQRRWAQAKEQADAAKAQMEIAQRQWDTNKALVNEGFISKTALDNSQASYQGAIASYKAAIAGADVAQKSLDDSVLYAPFSGQIAIRSAQAGERVAIDGKVLEMVDLSQLEVEVPVSPSDSVDVQLGQVAKLQIEDRAELLLSKVKRISPSAQTGSRSVLIYLGIDKPQGLRNGLFAKGSLALREVKALAVPLSAVRTDKALPYVQLLTPNDKQLQVSHPTVSLGLRGYVAQDANAEPWVAVTGVPEGAQILKSSVGALRAGSLLTTTPAPNAQ